MGRVKGLQYKGIRFSDGEEAGIKSVTLQIDGEMYTDI